MSNFLGPVLLAPLFDIVGRRKMIAGTYGASGLLLSLTALLLGFDAFTAWTQTIAWMVVFFFASAAASSAYLTVSEIFPLEARALAIAIFYAIGTAVGGVTGPSLFGYLIGTGSITAVAAGYAIAAILMLIAAAVELAFGVDAEQRSLESITEPLSLKADGAAGSEIQSPSFVACRGVGARKWSPDGRSVQSREASRAHT